MNLQEERIRIGHRIKELRQTAGLTQQELADQTGMKQANIARIEGGRYNVGLDILTSIAKILNSKVDIV